jgi:HEAT repeat protein
MSEQTDDHQEPEGDRQGRSVRMIFAVLITLLLSLVLSWVFVPSVRVLGYQSILIAGPSTARRWSVVRLESYEHPAYAEAVAAALVMALQDQTPDIRIKAARALGTVARRIPGKFQGFVSAALINALEETDGGLREKAAWALGMAAEKLEPAAARAAVSALVKALNDNHVRVRFEAVRAIGEYAKKVRSAIIPAAIPVLIRIALDNRLLMSKALEIITRDPGAVPGLILALEDEEGRVRDYAMVAVGKLGEQAGAAIPALIAVLKKTRLTEDNKAAVALGKIGEQAIPALVKTLTEKAWVVRLNAVQALAKIAEGGRSPAAMNILISALKDKDANVRYNARKALAGLAKKAAEALEQINKK